MQVSTLTEGKLFTSWEAKGSSEWGVHRDRERSQFYTPWATTSALSIIRADQTTEAQVGFFAQLRQFRTSYSFYTHLQLRQQKDQGRGNLKLMEYDS